MELPFSCNAMSFSELTQLMLASLPSVASTHNSTAVVPASLPVMLTVSKPAASYPSSGTVSIDRDLIRGAIVTTYSESEISVTTNLDSVSAQQSDSVHERSLTSSVPLNTPSPSALKSPPVATTEVVPAVEVSVSSAPVKHSTCAGDSYALIT